MLSLATQHLSRPRGELSLAAMANPHVTHPQALSAASVSPHFDPVAYEARWPFDAHTDQSSAWHTVSLDDYMRSEPPSPAHPSRSPTPSPVQPAQVQRALHGVRAQPTFVPPMPAGLPVQDFDVFLSQIPRTMQPFSMTSVYVTDNGLMSYHAFADADGVPQICMVGSVARLQDISGKMHQRGAFAQQPPHPMWQYQPWQPAPPPVFVPQPTPYLHHPQPLYVPSYALPSHTLFQTQQDYAPTPAPIPGPSHAPRKPRKAKGKQKATAAH